MRLRRYLDVEAESENNGDDNDSQDEIDEEGEEDEDLDGFIVGDDASLEFDSDFEASDTGTPRREPASIAGVTILLSDDDDEKCSVVKANVPKSSKMASSRKLKTRNIIVIDSDSDHERQMQNTAESIPKTVVNESTTINVKFEEPDYENHNFFAIQSHVEDDGLETCSEADSERAPCTDDNFAEEDDDLKKLAEFMQMESNSYEGRAPKLNVHLEAVKDSLASMSLQLNSSAQVDCQLNNIFSIYSQFGDCASTTVAVPAADEDFVTLEPRSVPVEPKESAAPKVNPSTGVAASPGPLRRGLANLFSSAFLKLPPLATPMSKSSAIVDSQTIALSARKEQGMTKPVQRNYDNTELTKIKKERTSWTFRESSISLQDIDDSILEEPSNGQFDNIRDSEESTQHSKTTLSSMFRIKNDEIDEEGMMTELLKLSIKTETEEVSIIGQMETTNGDLDTSVSSFVLDDEMSAFQDQMNEGYVPEELCCRELGDIDTNFGSLSISKVKEEVLTTTVESIFIGDEDDDNEEDFALKTPSKQRKKLIVLSSDGEDDSKLRSAIALRKVLTVAELPGKSITKKTTDKRIRIKKKVLEEFVVDDATSVAKRWDEQLDSPFLIFDGPKNKLAPISFIKGDIDATPKTKPRKRSNLIEADDFSTPRKIITPIRPTPKTTSDVIKAKFIKTREALSEALFAEFNKNIFNDKLPRDLPVEWDNKLRQTAGRTWTRKERQGETTTFSASIELAKKVLDCEERLRITLSHEMCHAAAWLLDGENKPPHGERFWWWAKQVEAAYPDLTVTTRHDYDIAYKYWYKCTNTECEYMIGRHSDSVNTELFGCAHCKSRLVRTDKNGKLHHARPLSPYHHYVKDNYKKVKGQNSSLLNGDIMKLLSVEYRKTKAESEEVKENSDPIL